MDNNNNNNKPSVMGEAEFLAIIKKLATVHGVEEKAAMGFCMDVEQVGMPAASTLGNVVLTNPVIQLLMTPSEFALGALIQSTHLAINGGVPKAVLHLIIDFLVETREARDQVGSGVMAPVTLDGKPEDKAEVEDLTQLVS